MQVFGGYGYSQEFVVERLYRDAILMSEVKGQTTSCASSSPSNSLSIRPDRHQMRPRSWLYAPALPDIACSVRTSAAPTH